MKPFTLVTALILVAAPAFAATRTMTGKIGDSTCGLKHKTVGEHGTTWMTEAQCTEVCVKGGGTYVFTSGGKVYQVANQDNKDLAAKAGKTVRLSGDIKGTTITVNNIVAAPTKREKS
jgi:hypothetical protein